MNPEYLLARQNRAKAYLAKGDCARAIADLDRLISAGAAGAMNLPFAAVVMARWAISQALPRIFTPRFGWTLTARSRGRGGTRPPR